METTVTGGFWCGCCLAGEGAPVFGIRALQLSAQGDPSRHPSTSATSNSGGGGAPPAAVSSHKRSAGSAAGEGGAQQQGSSSDGGGRGAKRARPGPAQPPDDSFSFPVLRAASEQLHFQRSSPRPPADAGRPPSAAAVMGALQVAAGGGAKSGSGPQPAAGLEPIDPLLLHRPFCPWVNAAAQEGGSGGDSSSSPPGKLFTIVCPARSAWPAILASHTGNS